MMQSYIFFKTQEPILNSQLAQKSSKGSKKHFDPQIIWTNQLQKSIVMGPKKEKMGLAMGTIILETGKMNSQMYQNPNQMQQNPNREESEEKMQVSEIALG